MNYTPLDINSFLSKNGTNLSHKSFDINVVFLSLIVVTLTIMAILLFVLIQKKLQELAYVPFLA